ncbi:MAG: hypothetical protein BWY83_02988 [bacterium ADurb.Bin478]|nr:MAG: hypothetical protein BWY83_02988 [bacterium ADurb.Bin478]
MGICVIDLDELDSLLFPDIAAQHLQSSAVFRSAVIEKIDKGDIEQHHPQTTRARQLDKVFKKPNILIQHRVLFIQSQCG